jgi:hypothetical protein
VQLSEPLSALISAALCDASAVLSSFPIISPSKFMWSLNHGLQYSRYSMWRVVSGVALEVPLREKYETIGKVINNRVEMVIE